MVSAFVAAIANIGDLAYPMDGSKIKLKSGDYLKKYSAESSFVVEYLRKYESVIETASNHESVGTGVLFDEKTRGRTVNGQYTFYSYTLFTLFLLFLLFTFFLFFYLKNEKFTKYGLKFCYIQIGRYWYKNTFFTQISKWGFLTL
jgi:hypothetical protein